MLAAFNSTRLRDAPISHRELSLGGEKTGGKTEGKRGRNRRWREMRGGKVPGTRIPGAPRRGHVCGRRIKDRVMIEEKRATWRPSAL